MKQMTFAAEYAGKRKQTRKELFLIEMNQVEPWKGLNCPDRAVLPEGRRWPSGVPIDGDGGVV